MVSLSKVKSLFLNKNEISASNKEFYSIILSFLSIIFGSIWIVPWYRSGAYEFNFPGVTNTIIGLLFCMPMYARNFVKMEKFCIYSCLVFILNWTLCATISQLILGPDGTIRNSMTSSMFFSGIIFSWFGIRTIAGFGWLFFTLIAIFNITIHSTLPQFTGFLFLATGFFAFCFQFDLVPKKLAEKFVQEFRGDKMIGEIRENVQSSGEKLSKAAAFATDKAKKML